MNQDHAPTMVDVAKEAGVALGTVSKVVNGQKVGESYKTRVEQAIQKLGYQLNANGRMLRTDNTSSIAVLLPNTIHPFFAQLANYINLELEKRNYKMYLCFTGPDGSREQEYIQMALQERVDGIIALTYTSDLIIPEGIPFVTIDRFFSTSIPCVASDNFGGGYLAAQKLYECGCRHVAVLRINSSLISETSKRKDGFVSACVELGIPFESCVLIDDSDILNEPFEDKVKDRYLPFILEHTHDGKFDYDGLFTGSDLLAWQIIQIFHSMGIRVPEDVQIIGYDGIRMFGTENFIVSTIVQPVPEIAEVCVRTVLSEDASSKPSLICLPVSYAYGGSTLK